MTRVLLVVAWAFAVLAPCAARAGNALPPVGLLELLAFEDAGGWRLEVHLEGSDAVTSADLTPPAQPTVVLDCSALGPSSTECEFLDPALDQPGYGSLASLLAVYPAGDWLLTVNGSLTATVTFQPVSPDGVATVTSPPNGSQASATPLIEYTHGCTNCMLLYFEITDLADLELEALVGGSPPTSPGSVAYSEFTSFTGPKPPSLPAGEYRLTAGAAVGNQEIATLSDLSTFQYTVGVGREVASTFTVPEPFAASSAALAALLALARRRA